MLATFFLLQDRSKYSQSFQDLLEYRCIQYKYLDLFHVFIFSDNASFICHFFVNSFCHSSTTVLINDMSKINVKSFNTNNNNECISIHAIALPI